MAEEAHKTQEKNVTDLFFSRGLAKPRLEPRGSDERGNEPEFTQVPGVPVNPLRAKENLEVAEEMADHEQNQNHPRHRHDHLPADG
jgi:hypothetical protein